MHYSVLYTKAQTTFFIACGEQRETREEALQLYAEVVSDFDSTGEAKFYEVDECQNLRLEFQYKNKKLIDEVAIIREFSKLYPDESINNWEVGIMKVLNEAMKRTTAEIEKHMERIRKYGGLI